MHPSIAPEPSPSTTTQTHVNPRNPSNPAPGETNTCLNLTSPTVHPAESPLFNRRDGIWNPGESPFAGADTGGIHGMPVMSLLPMLTTATQPGNVHKFVLPSTGLPEGWVPISHVGVSLQRFRGYLRPAPVAPGQSVDDAAFEVVCLSTYNPMKPTMIVVEAPATSVAHEPGEIICQGNPGDIGLRFAYPGWKFANGITDDDFFTPVPILSRGAGRSDMPFNLVVARAIARLWERPAAFQMQRNVEIKQVIEAMLTQGDATWRPPTWPLVTQPVYAI
ncbi:MAG: hypothetical protein AB7O84_09495, partial [Planctomycetota bacterium]